MERVPVGARPPALDQVAVAALTPAGEELFRRISQGEPLVPVAREVAQRIGVTPGQVVLYVQWLAQAPRQANMPPEKTYGFPVQALGGQPIPVQSIPVEPIPASAPPRLPPPIPPAR